MGFGAEAAIQLILEAVLVCNCFEYGYEAWSSLTPVCEAYYKVADLESVAHANINSLATEHSNAHVREHMP